MTYVIERDSLSGRRYVGIYRAAGGTYKCAGTYGSHERAYEDEHRRSECERLRLGLQAGYLAHLDLPLRPPRGGQQIRAAT